MGLAGGERKKSLWKEKRKYDNQRHEGHDGIFVG